MSEPLKGHDEWLWHEPDMDDPGEEIQDYVATLTVTLTLRGLSADEFSLGQDLETIRSALERDLPISMGIYGNVEVDQVILDIEGTT